LKDQDFLAEIKKLNFAVDPISGEELDAIIHGSFKIKPETLAKTGGNAYLKRPRTPDRRPPLNLERIS
jgi:hypothetical protein